MSRQPLRNEEVGLGLFYQAIFTLLFLQNNDVNSPSDKIAAFFIYTMTGHAGLFFSLLYHVLEERKKPDYSLLNIFHNHITGRNWQFNVSFIFAAAACFIIAAISKGDVDAMPTIGFWPAISKILINLGIFFASVDLKKSKTLISAAVRRQITPDVENAATHATTVAIPQNQKGKLELELFYQILFTGLFMQNNEVNSPGDKITAFLIYTITGLGGMLLSLGYSLFRKMNGEDKSFFSILREHLSGRNWQFSASFMFAAFACILVFTRSEANLDAIPQNGFWAAVAKNLINLSIFFAAVALKRTDTPLPVSSEEQQTLPDAHSPSHAPDAVLPAITAGFRYAREGNVANTDAQTVSTHSSQTEGRVLPRLQNAGR